MISHHHTLVRRMTTYAKPATVSRTAADPSIQLRASLPVWYDSVLSFKGGGRGWRPFVFRGTHCSSISAVRSVQVRVGKDADGGGLRLTPRRLHFCARRMRGWILGGQRQKSASIMSHGSLALRTVRHAERLSDRRDLARIRDSPRLRVCKPGCSPTDEVLTPAHLIDAQSGRRRAVPILRRQ